MVRQIPGASDVKVEQTEGLPVLDVQIVRAAISRLGLNVAEVQDLVAAAVGGREAGVIFQGDRRFDLIVRLPETMRGDVMALASLPVPLPDARIGSAEFASIGVPPTAPAFVPLADIATLDTTVGINQVSRENGKRRIVVQANVRGRDIGSFVDEAESAVLSGVARAGRGGVLIKGGGALEELGTLTAIAFDKTGTITRGEPRLTDVAAAEGATEDELLSVAAAARQLSISEKTLANLVLDRRLTPTLTPASSTAQVEGQDDPTVLRRRIRELEVQLRRAESERETLKRATAFFAREDEQDHTQDRPREKR